VRLAAVLLLLVVLSACGKGITYDREVGDAVHIQRRLS
jgi:hypothetical protein